MTITSFAYLSFLLIGGIIYYLLPGKAQWVGLLGLSLVFYFFAGTPYTIFYLLFSTTVVYASTNLFESDKVKNSSSLRNAILVTAIVLCIVPWLLFSASDLWIVGSKIVNRVIPVFPVFQRLPMATALGMGYYLCMTIGYTVDCFWGTIKPQKNFFKVFLFICFFPQLITGPISRFDDLKVLYEPHRFSYRNLCLGSQRILWGFAKKLVLAERLAKIVNTVWGDLDSFPGFYRWMILLIYPLYLYSDFSGCMDIILGSAQLFDIEMPENFKNPFFSRNIQEFWRRWHITLGAWAKDYVMYPILKSDKMVKWAKNLKAKYGKKKSKLIVTACASAAVWLVMGIWHGGAKHIVGVSLYFWILIELEEIFSTGIETLNTKLEVKKDSFGWHFFQSTRTYLIYAFGAVFFAATNTKLAFKFIASLFTAFTEAEWNPWVFFDGKLLELSGLEYSDLNLIIIMVLLLIIVGALREKYDYARNWIEEQSIGFRWLIWVSLLMLVVIWGYYGPDFSVTEFIYKDF